MSVTAIILTKNEARNIADCITSIQCADEILVIDDESTDETVSLAESLGAKVISHPLQNNWAQQRLFAIEQAQYEWILFIDADERISEKLNTSITKVVKEEKRAYLLERHNVFHHNKATHGVLRPDRVLRLLPKDGITIIGYVHEKISSPYSEEKLQGALYHYTYDNWQQYFNKFNSYTTLAANRYKDEGKSCSFVRDIMLRPMWAFFKMYILDRGFLDGKIGFILSVNHYFYTMIKYVKLYYLLKSNGKL